MDWIVYVVLGLVQGITEWLPISSSGHLIIFQEFFNVEFPGLAFEVLLNFATFLALLIVFRTELKDLIIGFFRFIFIKAESDIIESDRNDFFFVIYLIVGIIPVAILGLLFGDYIESNLTSLTTVAVALIVTGLALFYISKIEGIRKKLNLSDAIWVGIFQAIALIPGISRSGATIFASLYRKLDRELAIRYSFFLAIPVSIGTMLLKIDDLMQQITATNILYYTLAFVVSLLSAVVALKWFIGIINKGKLIYFTYYCVTVGVLVLLYQYFL